MALPLHRAAAPSDAPAPSPQQQAVFAHVESSLGHAVVMATAGSGKTTTLVEVAHRLPAGAHACFLAFNRSTAAELRARLPPHVHATTVHALGRAALAAHVAHVAGRGAKARLRLEPGKYARLATDLPEPAGRRGAARAEIATYLERLAHFCRLELLDPTATPEVARLKQRYNLQSPAPPAEEAALDALLPRLLQAGREVALLSGATDFTDMVHLPATLDLAFPPFSFVCVDEAQDLSRMGLALVLRLVERGAKALFVGDEHQAIYAFAGADRLSLQRVRAATGATSLPLSVSFRCPRSHVALARRFSPSMRAAPGAPAGRVAFRPEAQLPRLARAGDLVLARTNAPLAGTALAVARAGRPVVLLGDELASSLAALLETVFPGPGPVPRGAVAAVDRHERAEADRIERAHLSDPGLAALLEGNALAHEGLRLVLAAAARATPRAVGLGGTGPLPRAACREALAALFDPADPREAVVISTIHKAKGREAARVFLLRPEELAPAGAVGGTDGASQHAAEADEVEGNVLFVALTRAKRELVLLERMPGAVAARLAVAASASQGVPALRQEQCSARPLSRRWDDVLRLALTLSRRGTRESAGRG